MDKSTVDSLIKEEKVLLNLKPIKINSKGKFKLQGTINEFYLDYQLGEIGKFVIYQKTIDEAKKTYQTRIKSRFLIRVDINGPSHMCSDGQMWINHIHVYRGDDEYGQPMIDVYKLEDYNDCDFQDLSGVNALLDFFKICNIHLEKGASVQGVI